VQFDATVPNVTDRVVCEAVRQTLEPVWEPSFHEPSHGFRPGRSCHTAIGEAEQHLADGYGWVVDIDLEKFFDRVCHQRLMSRLAQRVRDQRLLKLLAVLIKAKIVMPDGVVINNDEGVPQGGLCAAAHKPPNGERRGMFSDRRMSLVVGVATAERCA
jgi:RNA-directed DNA polymerase